MTEESAGFSLIYRKDRHNSLQIILLLE